VEVIGGWQNGVAERVTNVGSLPLVAVFVALIALAFVLMRRRRDTAGTSA
jgi:MYXO-CTERM domain-containing protein